MERHTVVKCEKVERGYRLTLNCGHTFGPDGAWSQHTVWRQRPVKYVLHCPSCEYRDEVLADYWSDV